MFDLIDESGKDLKEYGYTIKQLEKFDTNLATLKIDSDEKSKSVGLAKGEYFIVNSPFMYDYGLECYSFIASILTKQLKKLFKEFNITKKSKILIVGLGNPDIASDRLGKEVFDGVEINALSKNNNIFKFCPNIYFSTGIQTMKMVEIFIKEMKIDFCFIIDSLTTNNISRLGTSFQLTTSGMTPGSGVNRFGKRIDKDSMGIPCFSIGVPFMIFASSLNDKIQNDLILAPKDIKENVENAGYIIAQALNEVIK